MISPSLDLLYLILFSKSKNLQNTILSFSVNKLWDQLTIVLSLSISCLVSCLAIDKLLFRPIVYNLYSMSCFEEYQSFNNY